MRSLITHLRQVEAALETDDAERLFDLLRALADELGEAFALAVAKHLIDERTARRHEASAAAACEVARCA